MRFLFGLGLLACFSGSWAGEVFYRVAVQAPTAEAAEKLCGSGLELFDCQHSIGRNDLILVDEDFPKLMAMGLQWTVVEALPDPRNWEDRLNYPANLDYKTQYLRYSDMLILMEQLRTNHPTLVSRQQIGTSVQSRPVWAYRFGYRRPGQTNKPAIVVSGLTHAREWITGSSMLWIAHELALRGRKDRYYQNALGVADVLVIPCLNPDGYEFTFTNNRMWRKNRRTFTNATGVDLNRNFPTGWGGSGSSGNPSSDTYRGTSAASEPETSGYVNFMTNLPNLKSVIDYHSYSQLVLYPWAYTTNPLPAADRTRHETVGQAMRTAILNAGFFPFTVGQTSTTLYLAAGSSKDHWKSTRNALAYTVELRDTGQTGFLLPEAQIPAGATEAWICFDQLFRASVPR